MNLDSKTQMTKLTYSSVCDVVGSRLICPVFDAVDILKVASRQKWAKIRKAVYIIIDDDGYVAYVGSVCREGDFAVCDRMKEHSKISGRNKWDRVHILPLNSDLPESEVRKIEGKVGKRLNPYDNQKLPS